MSGYRTAKRSAVGLALRLLLVYAVVVWFGAALVSLALVAAVTVAAVVVVGAAVVGVVRGLLLGRRGW